MIPTFRSRLGLWCIRLGVLIPAIMAIGFVIFEVADCTLGLTNPGTCQHIPTELGNFALIVGLLGLYALMYATPVMIIVGLVAEWVARRR